MQITLYSRDIFWGGILILSLIAYIHGLFAHQKSKHRIDILEIERKTLKKEKEELQDGKEEKKSRKRS